MTTLSAKIRRVADEIDAEANRLRGNTMVTLSEGVENARLAKRLEEIARQLRGIIAEG